MSAQREIAAYAPKKTGRILGNKMALPLCSPKSCSLFSGGRQFALFCCCVASWAAEESLLFCPPFRGNVKAWIDGRLWPLLSSPNFHPCPFSLPFFFFLLPSFANWLFSKLLFDELLLRLIFRDPRRCVIGRLDGQRIPDPRKKIQNK